MGMNTEGLILEPYFPMRGKEKQFVGSTIFEAEVNN
jgi:hypothetical protein